ncbi:urease accessory protein UreE [Pollutimonas sp. M17]|jgi:urease accessory protein|uniref:urease accessory protein UreE n=1 Tax=Pollutimonas sp. M17 TaxID=2962065 RepID=UPI0021F4C69B|nr:urease accessory protein UreE [Pollutimonas sp. M17]UYO93577.1 urease accessory protein UreE [Pollutimonas sp. M17]
MRTVNKRLQGTSVAQALIRSAPKAELTFEYRRRSRQKLRLDNGEEVALVLNQGTILHHGDVLVAGDGQLIVVHAAAESVLRVTAETPLALTRAAYHLGNRHVLVEICPHELKLEYDAVLLDMLGRLGGLTIERADMRFEPESGAYGGGHKHGHDETFAEDQALAHAAFAAHDHAHPH